VQDDLIRKTISTQAALNIDDMIRNAVLDFGKPIIDWPYKRNITGKLQIDIGDYLIDEGRDKYEIQLTFGEMDEIANRSIDVAKISYK
jgi:type I restriction enzyme R subunit